jgi:hypothetical protein
MRALISRLLFDWTVWRTKRRLYRACPELRVVDDLERAARRQHRPVLGIMAERRRLIHAELSREVGRG